MHPHSVTTNGSLKSPNAGKAKISQNLGICHNNVLKETCHLYAQTAPTPDFDHNLIEEEGCAFNKSGSASQSVIGRMEGKMQKRNGSLNLCVCSK